MDPKQLRLSPHDDKIYSRFREVFPDMKIDILDENQMKSNEGKAVISDMSAHANTILFLSLSPSFGDLSVKNFEI